MRKRRGHQLPRIGFPQAFEDQFGQPVQLLGENPRADYEARRDGVHATLLSQHPSEYIALVVPAEQQPHTLSRSPGLIKLTAPRMGDEWTRAPLELWVS